MNWLHYLLEANLYLAIFYLAYYFFLSKETYYTLNRVYLLSNCVISFVLPVIQLGILKPAEPKLIEVTLLPPSQPAAMTTPIQIKPVVPQFTWQDAIVYVYVAGAAILLLVLLFKLYQLVKLTRKNKKQPDADYKLVYIDGSDSAFSFFNFLFIGTRTEGEETIIRHELVHIRQKHSADIIFIELFKIINWFNPFVYLLQVSLRAIHEYIADEKTVNSASEALAYSSFLVNNAYGLSGSSITHSFFNYNLLKKRIIMLHQKRSGNLARLKYLLALPVCAGMLCASTLAFSKSYGMVDLFPRKTDTTQVAPPPPPAPPLPEVKLLPPPPSPAPPVKISYLDKGVTKKGYKYTERKYVKGNTVNLWVSIYDKDGSRSIYTSSSASAADVKLLNDKYGYTFPAKDKYQASKASMVKFPPPVIVPNPPAVALKYGMKPPPPPPFESIYKDFFEYVRINLPYPAGAMRHQTQGNVVAQYTLDGNQHIIAEKIISSSDQQFDASVINAIKTYNGNINKPAGDYAIGFRFNIEGETDHDAALAGDEKMEQIPNMVGILTVLGDAGHKKLPPPAPAPPVKSTQNSRNDTTKHKSITVSIVPYAAGFDNLRTYLAKTIVYPTMAINNKTVGYMVATFTLNNQNSISNIKIQNGIGNGCDDQVIKALKNYTGNIQSKPGTYSFELEFLIVSKDMKVLARAKDIINPNSMPNYAGIIQVPGFSD